MREYYPKYAEIPKDVFDQVKGILKGYDRLKHERLDILHGTPPKEEGHSANPGKPTEQKAVKLAYINGRLEAIDQACVYMRGNFDGKVSYEFDPLKAFWNYDYFNCEHIRKDEGDTGPVYRTWLRYRHRFAAIVAENLKIF